MIDGIKPSEFKRIGGILRNPLVVFGIILLAGDGPLVTAYVFTADVSRAIVWMWATILFVFGMGAFFCYLVAFKPRHLYAPDEIPERAIDKRLYQEPVSSKNILKEAQDLVENLSLSKNEDQRKSIVKNINARLQIVNEVQTAHELLLIPGYDISLIFEILESISHNRRVDSYAIAQPRNITTSTVDSIVDSMHSRNLLSKKHGNIYLTEGGRRLLNSLIEYLNAPNEN